MRIRWRRRGRLRKAATALVALALLPVAILLGSASIHAAASSPAAGIHTDALGTQDTGPPTAEALQRSEASGLFGPFSWDGQLVSGPFVSFDFSVGTGAIVGYFAVNGTNASLLIDTIRIAGFVPTSTPQIAGATFTASASNVSLVVHDEPTALLEIHTTGQPRSVELSFPNGATDLAVSHATEWPHSGLAFGVGASHGRLMVGRGNLTVNGTTVTADLQADDYLALRAVPAFAEHAAERTAVLDAFASGRLAAEYEFVAMSGGGWLENTAQYQGGLAATSTHVEYGQAKIDLGVAEPRGGVVILAFDPETMPADAQHRLVVTQNGSEVQQATSPVESLYTLPGTSAHPSFSLLAMNATVLVIYLPELSASPLQIESLALPASPGLDEPTELAMVAAVFVVSLAAAVMLRRPQE